MNLRNNIKKILKEESNRKSKIVSMIEKQGFILTTMAVGGINHLASILDETPETLLTKYLRRETFSTDDIEKDRGGYNFKFKLLSVKKSDRYVDEHNFDFLIEGGTVTLIMTDDETEYDLLGDDIREYVMWWEIKHEIQDLLSDFVEELIDKIKFDDVKSASVNYIFKGRDRFNYINEEKENYSKLENRVKKMIDTLTKDIEFPENFYDFMVDVIEDKKYDEKILKVTTVMKKPFSQEDSDEIDAVKRDIVRQIKSFFKGMFDSVSGGGTSTLEIYNRDKDKDFYY